MEPEASHSAISQPYARLASPSAEAALEPRQPSPEAGLGPTYGLAQAFAGLGLAWLGFASTMLTRNSLSLLGKPLTSLLGKSLTSLLGN